MLFMVIEHFKDGNPGPVYERFRDRGRMAPPGLGYVGSWVTADLDRCYQVMECADRALLDEWIAHWSDLVRFDVVRVMTSSEAQSNVLGQVATRPRTRASARGFGWAVLIAFLLSLCFPIVAATLFGPEPPRILGIADVVFAAVFAVGAITIVARPRGPVTDADRLHAHAWTERVLGVVPVLLAVFLVAGSRVNWTVLVIGLAWRFWLLLACLPYLIAALRSTSAVPMSH
jgi:hypothetical protein